MLIQATAYKEAGGFAAFKVAMKSIGIEMTDSDIEKIKALDTNHNGEIDEDEVKV